MNGISCQHRNNANDNLRLGRVKTKNMDLKKIYSIARAYRSYDGFKSHIDNEIHNHPVTAISDYKYKLVQDGVLSDVSGSCDICDICGTKPTKNCSICRQETA